MKPYILIPLSMLAGALTMGAAQTAWQHFGASEWADGHYECHTLDRRHLCFWIGDPRADGQYIVPQP